MTAGGSWNLSRRRQQQGSVLAITLMLAALMGLTLAAYLDLVSSQNRATARSQAWNSAIPCVEAGLEEGLTQLFYNSTNLSANGWISKDNIYYKSRVLDSGRYEVAISNCIPPVVYCTGYVPIPFSTKELSRVVRVNTSGGALFARGILTKGDIDMGNGNTDSFDSLGSIAYDSKNVVRRANGDIASIAGDVRILSNGDIFGHVAVAPGGTITNSGYIGPVRPSKDTPSETTTAGYTDNTLNASIPDVQSPSFAGAIPLEITSKGQTFSGSGGSGKFTTRTMAGNIVVTNGAKVVLLVKDKFAFTGSEGITISSNSSLTLYLAGASADIGGNGVVNQGNALNCSINGLNTCTSISIGGNGRYIGTINAPYADLIIDGGGKVGFFVGAAIVNSATFKGNGADFHYDENLKRNGPRSIHIVTSWSEL